MTKQIQQGFGLCKCGHPEYRHYATPSGRFVCSVNETYVTHTTRGLIGEPVTQHYSCDCTFYAQPDTEGTSR